MIVYSWPFFSTRNDLAPDAEQGFNKGLLSWIGVTFLSEYVFIQNESPLHLYNNGLTPKRSEHDSNDLY